MYHLNKGKTTQQAHVNIPDGLYEEEFGRSGFFGPVSQLYHLNCPTGWTRIEGALKPRAFDCNTVAHERLEKIEQTVIERCPVLYNEDVVIAVSRPKQ